MTTELQAAAVEIERSERRDSLAEKFLPTVLVFSTSAIGAVNRAFRAAHDTERMED